MPRSVKVFSLTAPVRTLFHTCRPVTQSMIIWGNRETMPANRMMEMPLPMPNSPSHIRKAEPAVKEITMTVPTQNLFSAPPLTRP